MMTTTTAMMTMTMTTITTFMTSIDRSLCYIRESNAMNKFAAVEIHVKQESVDFFRGAYAGHVANPTFVQHEMKVREVVRCFDLTDVSSLPLGSVYSWVTRSMRVLQQRSMRPQLTGELEIINATLEDSGFYRCVVTSTLAHVRLIFERPIIIYGIPEYSIRRDIVFRAYRMDRMLSRQVYELVHKAFCKGSYLGCIFAFRDKGFSSRLGFYYYAVEMRQFLDSNYKQPKCDPACIRQNAMTHMLFGELRTQAFVNFRWRVVERIRSMTKFIFEEGQNDTQIEGRCKDGFFLWQEQMCLPCLPGTYGHKMACLDCGFMSYQTRFAAKSCRQCPNFGFSFDKAKSDPDECVPFGKNRMGHAFLALVTATLCLVLWVCALHCGLLPCIYKPDKFGGRATFKDEEYLKTLDRHRRKAHRIKRLLTRARRIENELIESYARKKMQAGKREEEEGGGEDASAVVRSQTSVEAEGRNETFRD